MLYGGLEAFTRYDEALGGTIIGRIDVAHNEYLNILYHQGNFCAGGLPRRARCRSKKNG